MTDLQILIYSTRNFDLAVFHKIMMIRQKVFVVEQNCPYLDCDDMDLRATHVVFYTESKMIAAYCRIFAESDGFHIGRVLVSKEFRGEGLARKLMLNAIKFCKQQNNSDNLKILLSAQVYLIDFYKNLGFLDEGNSYLEDGIAHQNMFLNPNRKKT